jgi:hypothetical protein
MQISCIAGVVEIIRSYSGLEKYPIGLIPERGKLDLRQMLAHGCDCSQKPF